MHIQLIFSFVLNFVVKCIIPPFFRLELLQEKVGRYQSSKRRGWKKKMKTKKEMTEEDIKHRYITPAINQAGWKSEQIWMEHSFTDGRIIVRGI